MLFSVSLDVGTDGALAGTRAGLSGFCASSRRSTNSGDGIDAEDVDVAPSSSSDREVAWDLPEPGRKCT